MGARRFDLASGFLTVDSDLRISCVQHCRFRSQQLNLDFVDDRATHFAVAEYLAGHSEDQYDFNEFTERLPALREKVLSEIGRKQFEARVLYESFFDADPPWNVPGWSKTLTALSQDLYIRSALEIAVTIWFFDRQNAARKYTRSLAKAPTIEFDLKLLGCENWIPFSIDAELRAPFVVLDEPLAGVANVNDAWMFLNSQLSDTYAEELLDFLERESPSSFEYLGEFEAPIEGRPLGQTVSPLVAEAFCRNLTVEEGAESLMQRLMKLADQDDSALTIRSQLNFESYFKQVLETGFVCGPAIFDSNSARLRRVELTKGLYRSFLKRENVFDAWQSYVSAAKAIGVVVYDYSGECMRLANALQAKYSKADITAKIIRESMDEFSLGRSFDAVFSKMARCIDTARDLRRTNTRIIRVAGPNSPAIVLGV